MRTAIDTNLLFDLRLRDDQSMAARDLLAASSANGSLAICPVVYAEFCVALSEQQEVDEMLEVLAIHVEPFSPESLWVASRAWMRYLRTRGSQVQCPDCGERFDTACPRCGAQATWRQRVIADFLIGGHAVTQADHLITRDAGYFRTYFPELRLTTPG